MTLADIRHEAPDLGADFSDPEEAKILAGLQTAFSDVVTGYDAYILDVVSNSKPALIGQMLVAEVQLLGIEGAYLQPVEIDDNRRPLDEDTITALGALANENARLAAATINNNIVVGKETGRRRVRIRLHES